MPLEEVFKQGADFRCFAKAMSSRSQFGLDSHAGTESAATICALSIRLFLRSGDAKTPRATSS